MTYFNKPRKVNWDLSSIRQGYKAKVYHSNNNVWQFSDSSTVEILEVDKEKQLVTFDFSKRYDQHHIKDDNITPNSGLSANTEISNIIHLPFDYLADVVE
ncbi:MAG: hypothetical protein SOW21_03070 [[Actinobacillus] rossii]|nr:hypothetical protein [[Actinobacillus] rossii]MDY3123352.1 hypothetical protein [[Actinobacillus] rossii]